MAAPMIVRAESLMPIRVTDIYHPVTIEGVDLFGNKIIQIINVPETLKDGLNMSFYTGQCELIRPKFSFVEAITWRQSMPLKRWVLDLPQS